MDFLIEWLRVLVNPMNWLGAISGIPTAVTMLFTYFAWGISELFK